MTHDEVVGLLRRDVTPELHARIREEWKRHSIAEDRRDIPGLLSTLTPDCVYEIVVARPRGCGAVLRRAPHGIP
jgi:hypothetical protein